MSWLTKRDRPTAMRKDHCLLAEVYAHQTCLIKTKPSFTFDPEGLSIKHNVRHVIGNVFLQIHKHC